MAHFAGRSLGPAISVVQRSCSPASRRPSGSGTRRSARSLSTQSPPPVWRRSTSLASACWSRCISGCRHRSQATRACTPGLTSSSSSSRVRYSLSGLELAPTASRVRSPLPDPRSGRDASGRLSGPRRVSLMGCYAAFRFEAAKASKRAWWSRQPVGSAKISSRRPLNSKSCRNTAHDGSGSTRCRIPILPCTIVVGRIEQVIDVEVDPHPRCNPVV
jgi:hypothetical protein